MKMLQKCGTTKDPIIYLETILRSFCKVLLVTTVVLANRVAFSNAMGRPLRGLKHELTEYAMRVIRRERKSNGRKLATLARDAMVDRNPQAVQRLLQE